MRLPLQLLSSPTVRQYCSTCKSPRNVAKSVYFSKCTDIFTNLALEDWMYRNMDFSDHHVLMLWRNEPCVVIGRHQNPWIECNFAMLPSIANGVKLARRNSGGGTVYHDMNNLNLTFFTSRKEYCRKKNLELISRALQKSFNIHSEISPREDLCIRDLKISGTASKLGRTSAYHHCTVLINADKDNLSSALKSSLGESIKTNASISVKSRIMNLSEEKPNITVEDVLNAIIAEFQNRPIEREDFELNKNEDEHNGYLKGARIIEAIDEVNFPGVTEIKNTFLSRQWRFEKTPKFEVFRNISCDASDDSMQNGNKGIVFLTVEQGKVTNAGIKSEEESLSVIDDNLKDLSDLFKGLVGKMFGEDVLGEFEMIVSSLGNSEVYRTIMESRN